MDSSEETGIASRAEKIDLDGMRASMGLTSEVQSITHRELQDRRELIRKRMEHHRHEKRGRFRRR